MCRFRWVVLQTFFTVFASQAVAQNSVQAIDDPIPENIVKGDIRIAAEPFVRLPQSFDSAEPGSTNAAWARVQYMYPIPDGSGRLVINDLRGLLYLTDSNGSPPVVYLDVRTQDVGFDDSMFPNETGLAGFAFHPQFAQQGTPGYGKFYTSFSVGSDTGQADYLDDDAENHESVVWEWTADDHSANRFAGSSREVFRIGQFAQNHNIGNLAFNPAALSGTPDYGALYFSLGDGGGANDPAEYGQSLTEPMSSIVRIDPLRSDSRRGYGIPIDNPFVSEGSIAQEIWAYGLRHAQHFSFDHDGTMYINDIGQAQIEEVNIGVPGGNYGWRLREGTFATAFGIGGVRPNPVYPKPEDEQEFIYPVAQFDHDEGNAISSGFVYRGDAVPQLQDKYVFTDMVSGRIFYFDVSNLNAGVPAPISELRVYIDNAEVNLAEAVGFPNTYGRGNRAGLRLGIDGDGELYLLTKGDGWVRKVQSLD